MTTKIQNTINSSHVVYRCTAYESAEVASFSNGAEARMAFDTLVRMSSSQRDYWYEVVEIITNPIA